MNEEWKNELISIVVPVYNAVPYLKDTFRSIQQQTYENWELLLVDDASTDNSVELIMQEISTWEASTGKNNIRLYCQKENQGPATARNIGIHYAKGRYLVYQDADDVWDKNKLEKQLAFQKERNCAFSFTGYEFADETAKRNGKVVHVPEQITYREALKNTTISTITVMFDCTKIPQELLLQPENCQREDTATWWKILKQGYIAYGLDEPLSVYRRHAGSHSSNKFKAVWGTWRMYREQENMGFFKTMGYMLNYIYGAVKRRL